VPSQVEQPSNVPQEGMFFPSFEEAKAFYVAYADSCGFGVKTRQSHYDRGVVIRATLTCSKEGTAPTDQGQGKLKPRLSSRVQCTARIRVSGNTARGYNVNFVDLNHNHRMLDPEQMRFLRQKRTVPGAVVARISVNDEAGISAAKTMQSLVVEAGGYDKLTFNERDLRFVFFPSNIIEVEHFAPGLTGSCLQECCKPSQKFEDGTW